MTDESGLEIDDAIVLLLGAPATPELHGTLRGITRLEKLVFLLERETAARDWLSEKGDFTPYNFGPFSIKVYKAIDTLSAAGIITDSGALTSSVEDTWEESHALVDQPDVGDPYRTRDFALTARGWKYYAVLESMLEDSQVTELVEFKRKFGRLPLRQLVRYVYQRYESFTANSLIRDEVLRDY